MDTANSATFEWDDYTVFFTMLGFSTLIGVYFGCFGKKQKTVEDYMLGGKNMKVVPVAWSLIASGISGVTLIGVPAEVYTDNGSYWLVVLGCTVGTVLAHYFIISIFSELDMPSTFQYLELRFDRSIRLLASWFSNIAFLLYIPAIIYVPSLTLSQVTGINLHYISVGVTAVCVFYTMIGGMKAVIWTDFFQLTIMIFAFIAIVIIGTIDAGGFFNIFKTGYENHKLDIFNFDPNPFERNTFWTIFIGSSFRYFIYIGTSQSCVQRYLSLSSKNNIYILLIIFVMGTVLFNTFYIYAGLVVYKTYYGCDPVEQKIVPRADQIFPHYIIDRIGYIPVLPGLFIAAVFSAALSSLSTALNTISGLIYEDNMKRWGLSDATSKVIMKLLIVTIGVFSVVMVIAIEKMGKILSVVFIITSITSSPVSVMFILGMMVPVANKKGVIAGSIVSASLLAWIATGATLSKVNSVSKKIYPINTCMTSVNSTAHLQDNDIHGEIDDTFILYKLSYMMYWAVGVVVGVTIGVITSYATGPTDPATIDPKLISPPLRRYLPEYINKQDVLLQNVIKQIEKYT